MSITFPREGEVSELIPRLRCAECEVVIVWETPEGKLRSFGLVTQFDRQGCRFLCVICGSE